jgi:gamma-glutamyltranspeptidase/glutathione hydrolase
MNFVKVPVQLLSKEYGDKRRELIDLDKSGTYQAESYRDRIYDRC